LAPVAAVALVSAAGGGISLVGGAWIVILGGCLIAAYLTVWARRGGLAVIPEPDPTTD
jgi:hypothetical protein